MFVPLSWKDDLLLPSTMILEAFLLCSVDEPLNEDEWLTSPAMVRKQEQETDKPENQRLLSLIYESTLEWHNREWRINCPPIMKGLCDRDKRAVFVTEHSLGISFWSPPAFNEHFGK